MKIKTIAPLVGAGLLVAASGFYAADIEAEKAEKIAQANPTVAKMETVGKMCNSAPEKPEKCETPFIPSDKIPLAPSVQCQLREIAAANGVPFVLALAVIDVESTFQTDAQNGDSYGLMQVSTIHAPREILLNPIENIRHGCYLLGAYRRKFGDWNKALTIYNRGEYGARNMWSSEYSRKVLLTSEKWARMLGESSVLYGEK